MTLTSNFFTRSTTMAALVASIAISASASAQMAKFDARTATYCTKEGVTGSMIPRRVCASRQQWIDSGMARPAVIAAQRPPVVLASNR